MDKLSISRGKFEQLRNMAFIIDSFDEEMKRLQEDLLSMSW